MEKDINLTDVDFSTDDSVLDPDFNFSALNNEVEESAELGSKDGSEACVTERKNNQRELQKKLRNEGKSYITSAGKSVPERAVRKLEFCRKKCSERISFQQQNLIHQQYWELGSYQLRQAFIAGLIEIEETKTSRKTKSETKPRKREHTYNYFLEVNGKRLSVCQKCFRFTLCESEQFIKTTVRKKLCYNGAFSNGDMRGKRASSRMLTCEKKNEIKQFINSFPSYESHYTRRDTSNRYLSSDLSIAELHRLYCSKFDHSVSLTKFSQLFHSLNLKFKKPKVDTCHKCDSLKAKIVVAKDGELDSLKLEQKEHHIDAERAYESKKLDKEKSWFH